MLAFVVGLGLILLIGVGVWGLGAAVQGLSELLFDWGWDGMPLFLVGVVSVLIGFTAFVVGLFVWGLGDAVLRNCKVL